MDEGILIAGIPIPSAHPVFLATLAVHVPAGLVAVVAGVWASLCRKQAGRHPTTGNVYYRALIVVFATAIVLTAMRPREAWHLGALGAASFAMAALGRAARRRHRDGWLPVHITTMGASFVLLLTAFYVDNGPNLVGWRDLPRWILWIGPAAVGVPLTVRSLMRHPRKSSPPA